MKVFLLGLDGMTLKVVEPYIRANLLPNFKKVFDGGSYGILRSTIPPITGPAWTSLTTGKNPGKHGIYEFRRRKGYKTNIVTKNTSPYAEPIWKILSRNGKNVAVINVPYTYPPDEVNGVMISGMMTPSTYADFTYPKEVKRELFKLVPGYRLEVNIRDFVRSEKKAALSKEVFNVIKDRRKVMNHFLQRNSWDLFFFTFMAPDRLQHYMWDEVASMNPGCVRCFRLLDDILGDILERMDNDTVLLIVSDHGFKPIKKAFYINSFLKKLGLLHVRGNQRMKSLGPIVVTYKILVRLGMLNIKKYLPTSLISFIRNFLLTTSLGNKIDWDKTKVFSMLQYGIVNINLKGREPKGIVEKEDYDQLCEILREELLRLEDRETGKKVVKAVYKGIQIYSPENSNDRPDLVVVTNEGYFTVEKEFGEEVLGDNKYELADHSGDHDLDGFFAAYGSIINNKRVEVDICDIMPTILYLTGTAIPDDVDGRILTHVIHDDFVDKNEIKFEKTSMPTHSKESLLKQQERKELEQRLKNLGYLS